MKKINVVILNYSFSFSFSSIVIWFLIFSFLCSLGIWQVQRSEEKKHWLLSYSAHANHFLSLDEITKISHPDFYSIQLKGYYDSRHIVLLDNKIYQHQVGYEVLVPFVPEHSNKRIWVNRGWIPRGRSRSLVPNLGDLSGEVSLNGKVRMPNNPKIHLGRNIEKMNERFFRLQFLQIGALEAYLNESFYPFEVLLLSDNIADSIKWVRDWKPKIAVMPSRHMGYAVQWFSLAVVFSIAFVVFHAKRKLE